MIAESQTPVLLTPDGGNITDLLLRRLSDAPAHVAFEVPDGDGRLWRPITTAAFTDEVKGLAKGLIGVGVQQGDSVAIMAATRYEWAVADLACWFAGAVVVPVYDTAALPQIVDIISDASVRLALTGDTGQASTMAEAFASVGVQSLGVWTMDASGADFAALMRRGASISDETLDARRAAVGLNDVATIVYTSGTTGQPKGALLTHRNFVHQVLNVQAAYAEVLTDAGNTVIFLPMAHVLARALQLCCLCGGMRVAHLSDPRQVVSSLAVVKPTFLVVVPRVLQRIVAGASAKAEGMHLRRVWSDAYSTAVAVGDAAERRVAVRWATRAKHRLYDKLFYSRIRALLGGRLEFMLSGAAALDADLSRFFAGIGVPVIEGYGLTETTAPVAGNLPRRVRSGTVGVPVPGSTIRIADDGEVLVKGAGVFGGYRNQRFNADAFVEGFFRTGDLGSLDADGYLTITGRSKDVFVTAGGKTIAPGSWEALVEADPLVAHAMMVGDGRPYLTALLILDPDVVSQRFPDLDVAPPPGGFVEVSDPRVSGALASRISDANLRFSRSEQVRGFACVVADLAPSGGLLTTTGKLRRPVAAEVAASVIGGLY